MDEKSLRPPRGGGAGLGGAVCEPGRGCQDLGGRPVSRRLGTLARRVAGAGRAARAAEGLRRPALWGGALRCGFGVQNL